MAKADLQRYPWNFCLIKNMEDIILKCLILKIPVCPAVEMRKSF